MPARLEYKWIVAIVFVVGLFMELLDTTVVNVAIPTLAEEFNSSTTTIQWVVTAYLLALGVTIPVSGWVGDRFGTKRTFLFALAAFTGGSILCGLAWSAESLIAFRVLQGVGGGMLSPVGTAMLFRAFPPSERAAAAAVTVLPVAVAPALGPIVGGYLVEYQDWRWIFFVNIPIGIVGMIFTAFLLKEEKQDRPGNFDLPGFTLAAAGLATLLYGLSQAGERGLDDARVLGFGGAGLLLLATFTIVELRAREPMIDIRLFKNRLFRTVSAVMFLSAGAVGSILFLLPLMLQSQRGLSPLESGLVTFPMAIGFSLMAQPAGRLYPRIGPRRMVIAGLMISLVNTLIFVFVDLGTDEWMIRGLMLMRGMGMCLTFIPLQTAAFATISAANTGRASAVFNANFQVSGAFMVALLATLLTGRLDAHSAVLGERATDAGVIDAFSDVFVAATVLAALAVAAAFLISDRDAAPTMQTEETEDNAPIEPELTPA